MAKLDPRLRFLMRARGPVSARTAARFGVTAPKAARKRRRGKGAAKSAVEVLVRLAPGAKGRDLEAAGMRVTTVMTGPHAVASGEVPISKLSKLRESGAVHHVEAARQLMPELDLCVPEVRADLLHEKPFRIRGMGAFVGIIDASIDYRHPDFQLPDRNTRIRYLWDHRAAAVEGGRVPFGREYTSRQINAALRGEAAARDIPARNPNPNDQGHGTHVAGIAAGGGRACPDHVGFAPDADLIVVMLDIGPHAPRVGRSPKAVDAFKYVIDRAAGTPVAINLSRGTNGGGHAGETVLETALENFARQRNVAIIKSAGNEPDWDIHAGGMLTPNRTKEIRFKVPKEDKNDDIIEVWFSDWDDVSVAVKPPTGHATGFVRGESEQHFTSARGNGISISVDMNSADTGDTAATVILSGGKAKNKKIQPGTWKLLLKAGRLKSGHYDAWIERAVGDRKKEQARFSKGSSNSANTITIPGTARNVITVGSYVTRVGPRGTPVGELSSFSGKGPTRYGHNKPELVAPGEEIEAAKAGSKGVVGQSGTSMAAPAVAGVAALIMSQKRGLRSYQLRQILIRSARRTAGATLAESDGWGHGKLDALRALDLAKKVHFPVVSNVRIAGTTIKWRTNIPTTGHVRFSLDRRRVQLGKKPLRTLHSRTSGLTHKINLGGCPAGTYFCEITAFGPGKFFTEEDKRGHCYQVRVPSAHKRPPRPKA